MQDPYASSCSWNFVWKYILIVGMFLCHCASRCASWQMEKHGDVKHVLHGMKPDKWTSASSSSTWTIGKKIGINVDNIVQYVAIKSGICRHELQRLATIICICFAESQKNSDSVAAISNKNRHCVSMNRPYLTVSLRKLIQYPI